MTYCLNTVTQLRIFDLLPPTFNFSPFRRVLIFFFFLLLSELSISNLLLKLHILFIFGSSTVSKFDLSHNSEKFLRRSQNSEIISSVFEKLKLREVFEKLKLRDNKVTFCEISQKLNFSKTSLIISELELLRILTSQKHLRIFTSDNFYNEVNIRR